MKVCYGYIAALFCLPISSYLAAQPPGKIEPKPFVEVKPLEADPKDDELHKLMKERRNAAASEMNTYLELFRAARGSPFGADLFGPLDRLVHSGLELSDKPADRVKILSEALDIAREMERLTRLGVDNGRTTTQDLHRVRYVRLDLEIQLLRARTKRTRAEAKEQVGRIPRRLRKLL